MKVKNYILLIGISSLAVIDVAIAAPKAEIPATKTVWDGEIEPVHVYADPKAALVTKPTIDTSKEDALHREYYNQLKSRYSPNPNFQMYLPLDIADLSFRRIKTGYESKAELSGKTDKLSVYLSQNKHALHYFGLYKQRVLAWDKGKIKGGITLEQAIKDEARYPVLDIVITPESLTPEKLKYYEYKFGLRELAAIQQWAMTTASGTESTVGNAIASALVAQKINSGF